MFNRKKIKAIFSFGGWSVLAHIASIIFFSTDVIIANKIFGSVLVTIYYFGARWHQFIKSLVWNIFMNIVPAITSLEAEQKIVRIRQIMMYGTSRILMVTLPLCLIPSIFADELMYIWQGPGYGKSALILKIFLVPASVTMNIILMDLCLQGLGKVRFLGVNSILFAIVNIGLSLALALWTPLRLYGIAVSTSLCLFLRNVFVTPTYSFRFFSIRPQDYYLSMLRPVVLFLPVLASGYALNYFLKITSLLGIVIAAFGMTASYAILLWLFILSVDEKKSIRSTLRKVGIR
jgi:O-antigen/teichoic acid export membrane protein